MVFKYFILVSSKRVIKIVISTFLELFVAAQLEGWLRYGLTRQLPLWEGAQTSEYVLWQVHLWNAIWAIPQVQVRHGRLAVPHSQTANAVGKAAHQEVPLIASLLMFGVTIQPNHLTQLGKKKCNRLSWFGL
jgi:hypothetical protein